MHACYIENYGDPKRLRIGELPEPALRPGAVPIRVHATGLNPVDFKTRDGKLKQLLSCRMPLILGNELCGEVTEVGTQVSTVQVGERVARGWGIPSSAIPVRRCLRIFAEPGAR